MIGNKWLWLTLALSTIVLGVTFIPWVNWLLSGPLEEINAWYPSVGDWWLTLRAMIRPILLILTIGSGVALFYKRRSSVSA